MTPTELTELTERKDMSSKTVQEVFSSGGGTQSVCISVLIIQGLLPKPDYAVIADTGRERPAVWEYHHKYVEPALAAVGVTIHRVSKEKYATVDLFGKNGDLLLPAYTNESGDVGKLSPFCSNEWKKRVCERFLRLEHGVATKHQRKWIGFSLDEAPRAIKMMKSPEFKNGLIRFPLFDDVPKRREQSIAHVLDFGWPQPPRSACIQCPNQDDDEWRDLRDNWPDAFAEAVALDYAVRLKDPNAFLHRSCVPLDKVDFSNPTNQSQQKPCDSGLCFL